MRSWQQYVVKFSEQQSAGNTSLISGSMEPKDNFQHTSSLKMSLFMLAWETSSPHPTRLEAEKMIGLCCQIVLTYSAKSLSTLAAIAIQIMSFITCVWGFFFTLKRICFSFAFSLEISSIVFCYFSVQMRECGPAKVAFAQVETWRTPCACATTSPTSPYLCKWFP